MLMSTLIKNILTPATDLFACFITLATANSLIAIAFVFERKSPKRKNENNNPYQYRKHKSISVDKIHVISALSDEQRILIRLRGYSNEIREMYTS